METLNDILEGKEFNEMFDFENEKKEVEASGWNYAELVNLGQQLAKSIK